MATSKYVSDIKTVKQNHQVVFNFLSDFNNLGQFFNEYTFAQIAQQIPNASIDDFQSDADSCNFTISKIGQVGLRIIDREPTKTIKISGEGNIPFQLFLWIQILPTGAYESKIRVTLHADLNMMMKMMANKKLKDGINKLADALTMLPYR
jgi:carbon monoxide dehydrogenase subunit G